MITNLQMELFEALLARPHSAPPRPGQNSNHLPALSRTLQLNQYNLTILQNLNSTLVLFLNWHYLPKPEQTYFAFIHLISKYKTQSFCKLMERQVAENFGKVADMNERCPIALTHYQKLKVCPYSNISTFCRGRSCLLNSLQAFILMFYF